MASTSTFMEIIILLLLFGALALPIADYFIGPNTSSYGTGGNFAGTPITIMGVTFVIFMIGVLVVVYRNTIKGKT